MTAQIPVYIDGSNLAISFYNECFWRPKKKFSFKKLAAAVSDIQALGFQKITIVLPSYRKFLVQPNTQCPHKIPTIEEELPEFDKFISLKENANIKIKYCDRKNDEYDDNVMLNCATDEGGIVISNDKFIKEWLKFRDKSEIQNTIQNRCLNYEMKNGKFIFKEKKPKYWEHPWEDKLSSTEKLKNIVDDLLKRDKESDQGKE